MKNLKNIECELLAEKKIFLALKKALAEKKIFLAENKALAEKEIFLAEKETLAEKKIFLAEKEIFLAEKKCHVIIKHETEQNCPKICLQFLAIILA